MTSLDQNTPPDELRGLESMCAALHAATETDPVVKEVAWRTFALIRAHREQSALVDRLSSERDKAVASAKRLGNATKKVGVAVREAMRLAGASDAAGAAAVLGDVLADCDLPDGEAS